MSGFRLEVIEDPRDARDVIVMGPREHGPHPEVSPVPSEGLLGTLAAASRQASLPGAFYERLIANRDPDLPDIEGYDPFDDIAGFEEHAQAFVSAETPSDVAGIKARIRSRQQDRETLARAGLGGPGAEIAMNLLDPSFVATMAVPQLAVARLGRIGKAVQTAVEGAAAATTYEVGMQTLQEDRSALESALNIGAGTLLSGVLGALGRRVPAGERSAAEDALRREFAGDLSSTAGAAQVRAPKLHEEGLATGGGAVAAVQKAVPFAQTDLPIVLASQSPEARLIVQELADVSPYLEKNFEGIATSPSVESRVLRHEGAVADLAVELERLYAQHRQNPRSVLVGARPLKRKEFYEAVTQAARRGDEGIFPDVTEGARYMRSRIFDPLKREAQRLDLLPKDVSTVGAESYVTRLYDKKAIRKNRAQWDATLQAYFERQGLSRPEAGTLVEQVTRIILGLDAGQANFNAGLLIPNAGPLQTRTLAIEDELIEPFLISDPVEIAKRYVRELAPQVETVRVFGDKDMKGSLEKVRAEYDILRGRAAEAAGPDLNARLDKLTDEEQRVTEALVRVRDRVLGRAGRLSPGASKGERAAVMTARGWRNLVASARMGGVALTGGAADLARIAAQYGFAPTMGRLVQLAAKPAFRQMARAEHRRIGAATEVAMARRLAVASDGGATDGWTTTLAEGVYKYSGLTHLTDFYRTLSGTLLEDHILAAAHDVAIGKPLDRVTRANLARIGLDEGVLRAIHEEVEAVGQVVDGIRTSNSLGWRDGQLAERYELALLKESRITVNQPGAADRTWWADRELGRVLGQIKSFALGAPTRLTMEAAQLVGNGHALQGARMVGFMMVGGYLSYAFRSYAAGFEPTRDPKEAAAEAFTESGLAGILPDLVSPLARRFGVLGESSKFSDRNILSAYGGPAVGTAADFYDVLMNRTANGVSARDLRLIRRLIPGQNIWWLRRAINALEGETAEALDLEGAEELTFLQRIKRTDQLMSAAQRGGTGTGQVAY